jgi:putative tricarboxylic transport membrane protein
VGYVMRKFQYEPAPFMLAFVLSPMMEQALRQSLIHSEGSFMIFLTHPVSAGCLILAAVLLVAGIFPFIRRRREKVIEEA